jgi:hypothetical protein
MPRLTIYPLGNSDTARLDLCKGRKISIDFTDMHDASCLNAKRADLLGRLKHPPRPSRFIYGASMKGQP